MKIIKTTLWTTAGLFGLACFLVAPARADFVILDDLIVDGSACIGFDCVNGESFGFDTIRIKENNLRIGALDTSTAASYPRNDWQLTFNDSANGGQNKFSVDDISGGRTPFTIEANAPSHSLYVDDGGRLGLGTNTPSVEIHIKDGDTPTLRLEQDGSSGFAPQVWDVAGNETNFFVRDVTNGSKLPFRIRPDTPGNTIMMTADDSGRVGLGTASPDEAMHLRRTDGTAQIFVEEADASSPAAIAELFKIQAPNSAAFVMEAEGGAANRRWRFLAGLPGNFQIARTDAGTVAFELQSNGDLEIAGGLVTGTGGSCTAGVPCDGVFAPEFEVESIDEHAEYMWGNRHLRGVGPTPAGQPINLTRKTTGILNELEKAHIYIEELHRRLLERDAGFRSQRETIEELTARLDKLEQGAQ